MSVLFVPAFVQAIQHKAELVCDNIDDADAHVHMRSLAAEKSSWAATGIKAVAAAIHAAKSQRGRCVVETTPVIAGRRAHWQTQPTW